MANYKLKYKGAKIDELLGKVENMPSTVVDLVNDQIIGGQKRFTSFVQAPTFTADTCKEDDSYKYLALFSDGAGVGCEDEDGNLQEYFIKLPTKSGTLALTSDLQNINLDNYVTLDGSQTITGKKDFDELYAKENSGERFEIYQPTWSNYNYTTFYADSIVVSEDFEGMEYTYTLKIPTKNGTIATVEEVQNETKYIKEDLDQIEKDINTLIDTSVTLDTPQKISAYKKFDKYIEVLEKLEADRDIYSTEYYNGCLVINPLYGDPVTLKYPFQSGKIALTSDLENYYTKAESNGKYITLNTTQLVTGPKTFNGITVFANGNIDGDKVSGSKIAINGGMAKISNWEKASFIEFSSDGKIYYNNNQNEKSEIATLTNIQNNCVTLTGNQEISGVKTFSWGVNINSPSDDETDIIETTYYSDALEIDTNETTYTLRLPKHSSTIATQHDIDQLKNNKADLEDLKILQGDVDELFGECDTLEAEMYSTNQSLSNVEKRLDEEYYTSNDINGILENKADVGDVENLQQAVGMLNTNLSTKTDKTTTNALTKQVEDLIEFTDSMNDDISKIYDSISETVTLANNQEIAGVKTFNSTIYSTVSPSVIGKGGKVGMRAVDNNNKNTGQFAISSSTEYNGYFATMQAFDSNAEKSYAIRVSSKGPAYRYDSTDHPIALVEDIPTDYVKLTGDQEISGTKTFKGLIYTDASTPFLIGKSKKVGMRASDSDNKNLGQFNITDSLKSTYDNSMVAQMSAMDKNEDYHALKISGLGPMYSVYDHTTGITTDYKLALNKDIETLNNTTVALTGDQTITGPKTFTLPVIIDQFEQKEITAPTEYCGDGVKIATNDKYFLEFPTKKDGTFALTSDIDEAFALLKKENEELKSRIQTLEDTIDEIMIKLGI